MTAIGGLPCPNCKDRIAQLQAKADEYERVLELTLEQYTDYMEVSQSKHWCLSNKESVANEVAQALSKHRQKEGGA